MNDAQYDRLLDLILGLKDDVAELKAAQAANTVTLEEHARRSTASENRHDQIDDRMLTIENKDQRLNGFWKISLGVLGVVGSIATIVAAIHSLR